MPPRQPLLLSCEQVIKRALEHWVMLLAALLVLDVVAGVFTRYVLNAALPWTDELGGFLLGWLSFWGAALLFHDDGHISFGLIVNSFSKQWQRRVTVGGYFLCMAFFLVVAYQSVILIIVLRGSVGISVPVPKSLVYSVILLSSITATLLLSFRTIKIYAGKD